MDNGKYIVKFVTIGSHNREGCDVLEVIIFWGEGLNLEVFSFFGESLNPRQFYSSTRRFETGKGHFGRQAYDSEASQV